MILSPKFQSLPNVTLLFNLTGQASQTSPLTLSKVRFDSVQLAKCHIGHVKSAMLTLWARNYLLMIPMSISNTNHSRLASTHSSLPNTRTSLQFCPLKQLRFRRFLSLPLLLIVLLLAACGPETSASKNEDLVASTKQIALTYQASNDLAQAQTALNAVDVANPLQWLVYVTESVLIVRPYKEGEDTGAKFVEGTTDIHLV